MHPTDYLLHYAGLGILAAVIWYFVFGQSPRVCDFNQAKRIMEEQVVHDHRVTVYCQAAFDVDKNIQQSAAFTLRGKHAPKMNWEHAVPVSAFGPSFKEWHNPPAECKNSAKKLSRRQCLELCNERFRRMEADMYNLFPAITAVNAARSNRAYAQLPESDPQFGACGVKWARNKFEPPDHAKGQLARATLYMAAKYEEYAIPAAQRPLIEAWNEKFPVTAWECTRTKRIEKIQGNENIFVKAPCKKSGLW